MIHVETTQYNEESHMQKAAVEVYERAKLYELS